MIYKEHMKPIECMSESVMLWSMIMLPKLESDPVKNSKEVGVIAII